MNGKYKNDIFSDENVIVLVSVYNTAVFHDDIFTFQHYQRAVVLYF